MAKLLYVEASPRKERSHSIRAANTFLDAYGAAHPGDEIDRLDLWADPLPAFDGAMIDAKYSIMHGEDPSAQEKAAWRTVESLFERFNSADKYLFSVPMWNFGLPYILKHYIDLITQPGLSWSFSPETGYSGLVSGKAAVIYSSAGAYHEGSGAEAFDLQKPAFVGWLGFIGITDVHQLAVAPTLASPEEVSAAGEAAAKAARELAQSF